MKFSSMDVSNDMDSVKRKPYSNMANENYTKLQFFFFGFLTGGFILIFVIQKNRRFLLLVSI